MLEKLSLLIRLVAAFYTALASAKAAQDQPGYKIGQPIPVSCLNRTMYVLVVHVWLVVLC